ncbi:HPr family phosphocarrier protein [Peptoniphilus porci]|uniref:Phosphocarrier protein HPr n=1 Tax=Peptoniphilus porci TaxID=2652280 RepID=A0A1U7LZ40_9FIRM|nr:HPr family phosphocarrier protein [Peptoniphilus porci]OLR64692.1 PTS sugar transporter subunit IIA [Peptoniphilus porci]
MINKKVVLNNSEGLHARAAALFVREANKFASDINLEAHGDRVNGKSIIGIMSLGAFSGEEIIIEAEGADEEEAVERLSNIVEKEFINL